MFLRLAGQLRVSQGVATGVDIGAAFLVADALGVSKFALAEFFPSLEASMVRKINERVREGSDKGQTVLGSADHG